MDVFSRYVVLRALSDKTANAVADQLKDVFSVIGTPKILQCDRGTEFKGSVRLLMACCKVRIINCRLYHPES